MRSVCIFLLGLIAAQVPPATAEMYRWTDDKGTTHITDNPATIPPAYRSRVRASETTPVTPPDTTPRQDEATEPVSSGSRDPEPVTTPAPQEQTAAASIPELRQQIQAARQERQAAFERLRSERSVHTTPEFIRHRRSIAAAGRTLVAVEQRLEALSSALAEAHQRQAGPTAPSAVLVDRDGHDAAYWHRLVTTARERLQQVQTQRQALLARLTALTDSEGRPPERQGRDVLSHVQALEQLAAESDAAEAALERIRADAQQVGAPAAWLE